MQLVLATSLVSSVFSHSVAAVVAVTVLAETPVVPVAALAANCSAAAGTALGESGAVSTGTSRGEAGETFTAGVGAVEVGTIDTGAAASEAACQFAARTLLRSLSLGPRQRWPEGGDVGAG